MVDVAAVPGRHAPPRTAGWQILLAAFVFRLLTAVVAFFISVAFPLDQKQQFTMFGRTSAFWDPFARYDSGWFFQIARNGYHYVQAGRSNIAFFPMYPLLMRAVAGIWGHTSPGVYLAGVAISWTAFAVAMVLLVRLAALDMPRARAERSVLLIAVFPFAFFFGVVYSESLFLASTLATFYAFRRQRWIAGGLAGAIATATRVNGILMLPALAWIAWRNAEASARERVAAAVGLGLVACGIGAYSVYIYWLTGNPFEWAATIIRWGYHPGGRPWLGLVELVRRLGTHPGAYLTADRLAPYDTLNGATALLFIVSLPFVWQRLGAGYGLFMTANLWLPLSSGQFEGLGRYCAVIFPFFIWVAQIAPSRVVICVSVAFAVLYTLCLALFTTIHPLF